MPSLLFLLLWTSFVWASPSDKTYTLEDATRLALLNNAELLSAEQNIIISQQRVAEARYVFLPEFGFETNITKYEARYPFALAPQFGSILLFPGGQVNFPSGTETLYSGRAFLQQSLYAGQRHINTLKLTQAALKHAQSQYDSVHLDIQRNTKKAFYQFIYAQEKLKAVEEKLGNAETALKNGRLGAWESVEAEALRGHLQALHSSARHELDLARLEFLKDLNLELDVPVQVVGEFKPKPMDLDIEKTIVLAMELRPELKSETSKAEMDAIAVNLALSRRIPTVALGADYEFTDRSFPLKHNNWYATVGVRFPFAYDFWSQLKQKKAEQRQGQIKRSELQDRIRLEVRQAAENLRYWQRELVRLENEYRKIQGVFDSAKAQSYAGLGYIRGTVLLLEAQLKYLHALREHQITVAKLERAAGQEISIK